MTLIMGLGLLAVLVIVQIFLSKLNGRWPGLILPILTAAFSIVTGVGFVSYTSYLTTPEGTTTLLTADNLLALLSVLLYMNIPTTLLLIIYFLCRAKHRQKKGIDKMNIQDL